VAYPNRRPFIALVDEELLDAPFLVIRSRNDARGYLGATDGSVEVLKFDNAHAHVGFGPPTWFGRFENSANQMALESAVGSWPDIIFMTQQYNWSPHRGVHYTLDRNGAPADSGIFTEAGGINGSRIVRALVPDAYTLHVPYPQYYVASRQGTARVTASFDTRRADPNPPYLKSVSVLGDGVVAESIGVDPRVQRLVRFDLQDDHALASATLGCRRDSTQAWTALPLAADGAGFVATIPESLGYLSLRIQGSDASGNTLDYTLEPAVLLQPGPVGVELPGEAPLRLALIGATPNPAPGGLVVAFALPDRAPATIEALDVAGRRVLARDVGSLGPGRHVLDLTSARAWKPGVYFIRLTHRDRTLVTKACVLE
jgi:hypothetical protein